MFARTAVSVFCCAVLGALAAGQEPDAKPVDPAKAALIDRMMNVTHPDKLVGQFLQQYKTAFSRGLEESLQEQLAKSGEDASKYRPEMQRFEDQMFNLISERMSWGKMKLRMIALYDETFSKQELADIVAFYETPSGQSLLEKMPGLMAKASQVGQDQMRDAMPEIQRSTAEFMRNIEKIHKEGSSEEGKH